MVQRQTQHGVPAAHLLHIAELAKSWGISEGELCSGVAVRPDDLVDPHLSVPVASVVALVERARMLTKEPALGVHLGRRMSPFAHGFLGFAAMSAATLRDTLNLAVEYAPIRSTAFDLRLAIHGSTAALVIEERADFESARDVILLGLLIGLWRIGNTILGRELTGTTIDMVLTEPPYYRRFRHIAPRIRFGQSTNRLVFDASLLDAPIVSADRSSLRLALEQCDRLLESSAGRSRFVERARRLVLRSDGGARSLEELAAAVRVSSRTLRRRFAEDGIAYSKVLDQERRDRAMFLLRSLDLSVKSVAERLGYSGVSNFARAFRRWTGQTPAAFRGSRN
jgi:AraC-like DNA-binding protein